MKINDILDSVAAVNDTSPEAIMRAVTDILNAEDLPEEERDIFTAGYSMGLMFATQKSREEIATELLLRMMEWNVD